jgi:CHASE2 domain-containing sensor protein
MNQSVILSLGSGSLQTGFPSVVAEVRSSLSARPMKYQASLPPAPDLIDLYRRWQVFYDSYYHYLSYRKAPTNHSDFEIDEADVTHFSQLDFEQVCERLQQSLNDWLDAQTFRGLDRNLRSHLNPSEEIHLTIETNDEQAQRMPWQLWQFFEDFPHAEYALSNLSYQLVASQSHSAIGVKILVIVGDSTGIDMKQDRQVIQATPGANPEFLVEPKATELSDRLWSHGWDVLYFAGHSSSRDGTGRMFLNPQESLTIAELRPALQTAIANGLKLAIFNSCDGLKLATDLADLHIPATIIMREPVPNQMAQEFLKYFLATFSKGRSLHHAFGQARKQLHIWQKEFPCAAWLPTLICNPAEEPPTWAELRDKRGHQLSKVSLRKALQAVLSISLGATCLVSGVRLTGWLHHWEFQAYDQIMRWRPDEDPDPRLLIVKVTDADLNDLNLPEQRGRKNKQSLSDDKPVDATLSDEALLLLLKKLDAYQPRAIGLDIYQDYTVDSKFPELKTRLQNISNLFGICSVKPQNVKDSINRSPDIPIERNGFSDIPSSNFEYGKVVRRQLLFMDIVPESRCAATSSLSLQLALYYLRSEGIQAGYTSDKNLQLGSLLFKRLRQSVGGYQGVDTWGSQILINYRSHKGSPANITQSITLTDVLRDRISQDKLNELKNRIILIGVNHGNSKDYHLTPYTMNQSKVPGVVIQAQMVSQILNAVLHQRPLLQPLMWWGDLIWIWSWSIVAGLLVLRVRSVLLLKAMEGMLLIFLGSVYGILFIQGCWIPLIPSVLAILLTSSSMFIHVRTSIHRI